MKKVICIFAIVLTILVLVSVFQSIYGVSVETFDKENFIRIHIRAASDSEYDQAVKLRVKDEVVKYLTKEFANIENKDEAVVVIENNIMQLKQLCDRICGYCGAIYNSTIYLKKEPFPTKTYGDKTFPEGVYDALVIELDKGEGANWWCVAYPPLCFIGGVPNSESPQKITYKSAFY
ncbi:MAG: stage II sporulation protein R, partial [Clostridia bacterium]